MYKKNKLMPAILALIMVLGLILPGPSAVFAETDEEQALDTVIDTVLDTEEGAAPMMMQVSTAEFAGGDGSSDAPYLIETAEHLDNVRNYLGTEHTDKYFQLIENIDLDQSPYNQGQGWNPIGTADNFFAGSFDGNGKTISGLYVNRADVNYIGLFGVIKDAAVIDLTLEAVNITGKEHVGSVAGYCNLSTIADSCATGTVTGSGIDVGGLIGWNYDSTVTRSWTAITVVNTGYSNNTGGLVGRHRGGGITDSYASGCVTGNDEIGGLVGSLLNGNATGCHATGAVEGRRAVGGLAGDCFSSIVTNCYAEGAVTGRSDIDSISEHVGGLVGNQSGGSISTSYAVGNVKGSDLVGGLTGFIGAGTISNSYARGDVTGSDLIGGLVGGIGYSSIYNSYAAGQISGVTHVGGLLGADRYEAGFAGAECYYDTETTGQNDTGKGVPKTTAQMKQRATFNPEPGVGWDFDTIWAIRENVTYPYLQWQTPVSPQEVTRSNPRLAYGGSDGYLAVWLETEFFMENDIPNTNSSIVGQRIHSTGSLAGKSIYIAGSSVSWPSVAYDEINHAYLVVWEDGSGYQSDPATQCDILGQFVDAKTGQLIGSSFAICQDESDQHYPRAAYNSASGSFMVIWHENDENLNTCGRLVRFNSQNKRAELLGTGKILIGDEEDVAAPWGQHDVVGSGIGNKFFVVWADDREDSYTFSIYGRFIDAETGELQGAEDIIIQIPDASMPDDSYYEPSAAGGNGKILVTWTDYSRIYGRYLDGDTMSPFENGFSITDGADDAAVSEPSNAYNSLSLNFLTAFVEDGDLAFAVSGDDSIQLTPGSPLTIAGKAADYTGRKEFPCAVYDSAKKRYFVVYAVTTAGDEPDSTIEGVFVSTGETGQIAKVSVSANPSSGGTVTGGGEYVPGNSVTVSAEAKSGYRFINWTDSIGKPVSSANPYTFTMPDADVELTGNFEKRGSSGSSSSHVIVPQEQVPLGKAEIEIVLTIGSDLALVNGKEVTLDAAPYIKPQADRTMLPVRFLAEQLGAQVYWLPQTGQVRIVYGSTEIILTVGSGKALVNGKEEEMDCAYEIVNSRTFGQVRFICETLGATVQWDAASRKVTVRK